MHVAIPHRHNPNPKINEDQFQTAEVLRWKQWLPACSHLVLAATVIAASWVGWGQSKEKFSDIKSIFTGHFIELALDLWLVVVYYFIVMGVELPIKDSSGNAFITPSLGNEALWLMIVFVTYFGWDLWTKTKEEDKGKRHSFGYFRKYGNGRVVIVERGWASLACAALGILAFCLLPHATSDASRVILADLALISLVLLFRAMKLKNLSDLTKPNNKSTFIKMAILGVLFFLLLEASSQFTFIGKWIGDWVEFFIST